MAKELYLYESIHSYSAERLITSIEDNKGDEIKVRLNSPGGEVDAAIGIFAKMSEIEVDVSVDGKAISAAVYMLGYAKKRTATSFSRFVLHRGSIGGFAYEQEYMTSQERERLDNTNKNLRSSLEKRIDEAKLKELKGVTLDEVFSMDSHIDVTMNAIEAKEIGFIDEINDLSIEEVAAHEKIAHPNNLEPEEKTTEEKLKKMDKSEIKSKEPELYNEIISDGVKLENDRVMAWSVFSDVDAESVKEGIRGGEAISAEKIAEYTRKKIEAAHVSAMESESPKDVETAADDNMTDAEKEVEAFKKAVEENKNK